MPGFGAPQLPEQTRLQRAGGCRGAGWDQPPALPHSFALHSLRIKWFSIFLASCFPRLHFHRLLSKRKSGNKCLWSCRKKQPLLPPTLRSHPEQRPGPCPAAAGPTCLLQVTVEGLFTRTDLVTSHTRILRLDKKRALCPSPNLSARAKFLPGM